MVRETKTVQQLRHIAQEKNISVLSKMGYEKKNVQQLRQIAKEKGMTGYSRLRKAELVAMVSSSPVQVRKTRDIRHYLLDAPVSEIKVPTPVPAQVRKTGFERIPLAFPVRDIKVSTLVPDKYTPPSNTWKSMFSNAVNEAKSKVGNVMNEMKSKVRLKLNAFADWMINFITPREKKPVNERLESLKTEVSNIFSKTDKPQFQIRETATAIKGFAKQYTIGGIDGIDAVSFLGAVEPQVVSLLSQNRQTKANLILTCTMERVDIKTGEVNSDDIPIRTRTEVILDATDVNEIYDRAKDKIMETMASFQMRGSNWRFRAVVKLDINTDIYRPLKGSSYIPLPEYLTNKKAIINLKNDDDECFKWCITRALNPTDNHPERMLLQTRLPLF